MQFFYFSPQMSKSLYEPFKEFHIFFLAETFIVHSPTQRFIIKIFTGVQTSTSWIKQKVFIFHI